MNVASSLNRPSSPKPERPRPPARPLSVRVPGQRPFIHGLIGWSVPFFLIALLPARAPAGEEDSLSRFSVVQQPWQQKGRCGPNCLVLFLQSHGGKVAPSEVLNGILLTDQGASLQTLKEQSTRDGVPAEVVRATRAALDDIPLPAIAHVGQGTQEHYVLLCEVGTDHVVVVDGNSLSVERQDRAGFEKEWSSYLLVRADRSAAALQAAVLVLSILCILTAFICWRSSVGPQGVPSRQPVSRPASPIPPS